jgi:hypothetical protein
MKLLGDVRHTESPFGLFGDSVSFGASFAPYVPSAQKLFWMHRMVLLGDEAQMEARFGPFGNSVSFSVRLVHGLRQI